MKPRAGLIALFAADTISAAGTRISLVAIPWLVLITTGSPAKMGIAAATEMFPYVLAGVLAAPVADRFGLRRTIITANLGSAVALFAIASQRSIAFPVLLVLVAIAGGLRGIDDRSKNVLIRPIAQAAGLPAIRQTAIYEGLTRGASLVGLPLGGLLIYWFGAPTAIAIDGASFAVCAALVAIWVRLPAKPPPAGAEPAREGYFTALAGGFRYLRKDRLIFGLILMTMASNLFAQASTGVFIPLWVKEVLNSPAALGLVSASFAAGAILGNIGFTIMATKLPRYMIFVAGFIVGGAPRLLILGLSHDLALVLTVTFLAGVAGSSVNPIIGAMLYERVPAQLQTRVFGLAAAVSFIGIPLGGLLGGWAVDGFGLDTAILVAGVLLLAVSLVPLLYPRGWRALDTKPVTPALDPTPAG
jgi:MFS family permease